MSNSEKASDIRLSAIRGQDRAVDRLVNEFRSDRIHHAHLFTGPEGIGKASAARAWAYRALCANPQDMDGCGRCPSCVKLANESHPDLMWVQPDGATIRIAQAREIASATRYRPNEGRWRVIVIEQCEKMGEAAANALLKTLEEPGGQTLFILITSFPNLLLPTIRSRCAIVPFGRLSTELTEEILGEMGIAAAEAVTLARISRGAPGRALALYEGQEWTARREWIADFVRIANGDTMAGMRFAAAAAESRDRAVLEENLQAWTRILRDVVVLSSTKQIELVHNQDEQRGISSLARALGSKRAFAWIDALERARKRARGNVNLRLIMDSLVLEFDEGRA